MSNPTDRAPPPSPEGREPTPGELLAQKLLGAALRVGGKALSRAADEALTSVAEDSEGLLAAAQKGLRRIQNRIADLRRDAREKRKAHR